MMENWTKLTYFFYQYLKSGIDIRLFVSFLGGENILVEGYCCICEFRIYGLSPLGITAKDEHKKNRFSKQRKDKVFRLALQAQNY